MKQLQEEDPDIQKQKHKLQHNRLDKEYYKVEDGLLKQKVVDGGYEFCLYSVTGALSSLQ